MSHDPRPHVHRRRDAIGRLRSLTTGAAIAGIAGTAGFGVLAARTWSGDPTATGATLDTPADGTGSGAGSGSGTTGTGGTTRPNRTGVAPNTGGIGQGPTTTTPRVQRGSGTGHASTGGSN
jgi:hypothetical protein